MAQFSFKTSDAPVMTSPSRGPLPEGKYEVVIVNSDIKQTKAGTGEYIEVEMQVIGGDCAGRRIWERYNVNNPNKQAEDIARAALGGLCSALGVSDMTDTEQLHDIPFVVGLEIDRKDPTRNRVVSYSGAGKAPAAPARPAAAPAAGARPWAR